MNNLHEGNNGVEGSCFLPNGQLIASVLDSRPGKLLFKVSAMFSLYFVDILSKVSSELNIMTFFISLTYSGRIISKYLLNLVKPGTDYLL